MLGRMTDTVRERHQWNCATVWPPSEQALAALSAGYADGWSEIHGMSTESRSASHLREVARGTVAKTIGTSTDNVIFATCYGQALSSAVKSVSLARSRHRGRVIHSAIEHSSVHHMGMELTTLGMEVDVIPVDRAGHVALDRLRALLSSDDVASCVVQWVNAEIGTTQRLQDIHALTSAADVPLIVDATAGLGYLPPPKHWDVLVANGAAFGGPQTCTIVAKRTHVRLDSRPGAALEQLESVPECVATAVALREASEQRDAWAEQAQNVTTALRETLPRLVEDVDIVANEETNAPHILTISALYCDGESLVRALDQHGFNVGSGSACSSSRLQPSHVLAACDQLTHGNIRVGIAPGHAVDTEDTVRRFSEAYRHAVTTIREALS